MQAAGESESEKTVVLDDLKVEFGAFFLNGKNIGIVIYFIVDCWIEKRDNNIIYMTSWIYLNQYRLVICFAHIVWT
jgi:hypothetical protein